MKGLEIKFIKLEDEGDDLLRSIYKEIKIQTTSCSRQILKDLFSDWRKRK